MSVYQTARKPSFMKDVTYYGAKGENYFTNLFEGKEGYLIEDVRADKKWQNEDVDFIVEKDGVKRKIEVKVDCVGLRTGNLAYEVISHGKDGWCIKTTADMIYIVMCNEDSKGLFAKNAYWIDMHKWREMADKKLFYRANEIINENILDYLFKINKMVEYGAIVKTNEIGKYI